MKYHTEMFPERSSKQRLARVTEFPCDILNQKIIHQKESPGIYKLCIISDAPVKKEMRRKIRTVLEIHKGSISI